MPYSEDTVRRMHIHVSQFAAYSHRCFILHRAQCVHEQWRQVGDVVAPLERA